MNESITKTTQYLFNVNFFDDTFDPEGKEEHLEKSKELISSFQWNDIITEWHNYLFNNCKTVSSVINYANLFFYYGGAQLYNPDPYTFLGYLYAYVDMDEYWDEAGDLFDSISIDILQNQLLLDLKENPFYSPLEDPNILDKIEYWRNNK